MTLLLQAGADPDFEIRHWQDTGRYKWQYRTRLKTSSWIRSTYLTDQTGEGTSRVPQSFIVLITQC